MTLDQRSDLAHARYGRVGMVTYIDSVKTGAAAPLGDGTDSLSGGSAGTDSVNESSRDNPYRDTPSCGGEGGFGECHG